MKLPGMQHEVWFGFTNRLPDWRTCEPQPLPADAIRMIAGLEPDPVTVLVRNARRHGDTDMATAFEVAGKLPAEAPASVRADCWRHAGNLAAGAATAKRTYSDQDGISEAIALEQLATGAMQQANAVSSEPTAVDPALAASNRLYRKNGLSRRERISSEPTNNVDLQEGGVGRPIRRRKR